MIFLCVLEGDFYIHVRFWVEFGDIEDVCILCFFSAVDVANIGCNTSFKIESIPLLYACHTFVCNGELDTLC